MYSEEGVPPNVRLISTIGLLRIESMSLMESRFLIIFFFISLSFIWDHKSLKNEYSKYIPKSGPRMSAFNPHF